MSNLKIERKEAFEIITINRPDKMNALNKATIKELGGAIDAADASKEVKAIIITGAGNKAFVAGADISEFNNFTVEEAKALSKGGHVQLFNKIENTSIPVIAAINGFALGGGLELAMSCHIRVACTSARMGLPEVSLGVIPGYGGTQRLAQLAGKGKAFEMIFTGDMINAKEAYNCGLVNHLVEPEELMEKSINIAKKMAKNSSTAIASAIKAVNAAYKDGVDGFDIEIEEFAACFNTPDFKEGTDAFLEKRKPNFS